MAVKRHLGKSSKTLRHCQSNANSALLRSNTICVSEEVGEMKTGQLCLLLGFFHQTQLKPG